MFNMLCLYRKGGVRSRILSRLLIVNINILPLVEVVSVDYHKKKNITRDEVDGDIFSECGNLQ